MLVIGRGLAQLGVCIAAFVALGGCAGIEGGAAGGPSVDAPVFHVGDRWVYRASDGFRVAVTWEETHEVTAIDADGITVRVTQVGPTVNNQRTEVWAAPGLMKTGAVFDDETRRFNPPLPYYKFPLTPGEHWGGWLGQYNVTLKKEAPINRYVTVNNWKKVPTPAGTFDAISIRVLMRLDDDDFWREATECNYLIYYAPAVGAMVRAEKDAEYREKNDRPAGMGPIRTQHATLELVSYTRK